MATLDGAIGDNVECLRARYDLSAGKYADLDLPFGELRDALAHQVRRAIDRIKGFRPTCRHSPAHLSGLRNGGGRDRSRSDAGRLVQESASFHCDDAPWVRRRAGD